MAVFPTHFWVSVSFWIVTITKPSVILSSSSAVEISALIIDQRTGQALPRAPAAHSSSSTAPRGLRPDNVLAQAGRRGRPTSDVLGGPQASLNTCTNSPSLILSQGHLD